MPITYQWTPLVIAHTFAATSALVIGCILLFKRKGTFSHRTLGWVWVVLMTFVALVSFGIKRESFSWIHGLSVLTLFMLFVGIRLARMHNVGQHAMTMKGIYVGALLVTGLFTLLPSRLLGHALFGGAN
jgi:uncharacterized membrane protein